MEKTKMTPKTRKEAIAMCHGINHPEALVQALEAFGLLKFKPECKIMKLFEYNGADGGTIRLETWPEGLVLWVNGKIKYKYWEDTDK